MTLFDRIKKDQLQARKDKKPRSASALTCVIGDSQQVSKEPTDDQVIAVIRKHVKNLNETMKVAVDKTDIAIEITFLSSYLPQTLTDAEIGLMVANMLVAHDNLNVGMVMGYVKKQAQAQGKMFDGAQVKRVFDIYK